jgi:hypothetical protein
MTGRRILGALLVLVGAVWFLQGVEVLGPASSFMVGSSTWVLIGGAVAIVGAVLIFRR